MQKPMQTSNIKGSGNQHNSLFSREISLTAFEKADQLEEKTKMEQAAAKQ